MSQAPSAEQVESFARAPWHAAAPKCMTAAIAVMAVAAIAFALHFNLATAGSLLLLLVLVISLHWGFLFGAFSSALAAGALNFLFTRPLFSFLVYDPENWIALGTFAASAIMISGLAARVRAHAADANAERARTQRLYDFSRASLLLDDAAPAADQLTVLLREFAPAAGVQLWDANLACTSHSGYSAEDSTARSAYIAGLDHDDVAGRCSCRILRMGATATGALVFEGWSVDTLLADAFASITAIALERRRSRDREARALAGRHAEQLRTTVLNGLAHAFKTPLTAIQIASSGLEDVGLLNAAQRDLARLIGEEATQLNSLTRQLLQTAALDAQHMRLQSVDLQVQDLLREVTSEAGAKLNERVLLDEGVGLPSIIAGDAQLLKLALTQLLDNAARYAPADTPVHLGVRTDPFETIISVSNEGSFVPVEDRERIFERFQRGSDAELRSPGTGLGLFIVKKTAEAHNGRVWVECAADQTSFHLAIPSRRVRS